MNQISEYRLENIFSEHMFLDNITNISASISGALGGWIKKVIKTTLIYSLYLLVVVGLFIGGMTISDDDDNDIESFTSKFENIGMTVGDTVRELSSGDADGDGISDSIEISNENLSVDKKDIRIVVVYGSNIRELSSGEKEDLEEIWDSMDVSNPSNSSGVNFRLVDEVKADENLYIPPDSSPSGRGSLLDEWYEKYVDQSKCGDYHMVVLGEVRLDEFGGWGDAPGYSSIVDGRGSDTHDLEYSDRTRLITHELLHNIVGDINGDHIEGDSKHTSEGWLSETVSPNDEYLSPSVSDQLSNSGFKESVYHKVSVC